MNVEQRRWTEDSGWQLLSDAAMDDRAQLVFAFGGVTRIPEAARLREIQAFYPKAHVILASTAGEILGDTVSDGTIALTAVAFEKTTLAFATAAIKTAAQSEEVGARLTEGIPAQGLVHAMVFSDGLRVNGTALIRGLLGALPANVAVTGGLVGGGDDFKHTYVGLDVVPEEGNVVLVGFYGSALRVGYGSMGGWDEFGPQRLITKSDGNVLYELDGRPALDLYEEYLGDKAAELPASGLLFPLSLCLTDANGAEEEVVRTVLGVDKKKRSLTFAGDMPQGTYAKLMRANFERLIDGATGAAGMSVETLGAGKAELALLISCIGRKLVLKERVEEEVEEVHRVLGAQAATAGFYSYGEISPTTPTERQCRLHNQTMTVTTFREA